MQLNAASVASAVGLMTTALLAACPARAQDAQQQTPESAVPVLTLNAWDETASEVGSLTVDTSVLVYQEDHGRVRAIEPEVAVTYNDDDGIVYSGKLTYDSLTGASANGAVRSVHPQTFIAPINDSGSSSAADTSTGPSGSYTVAPGKLPVDPGFKDRRKAVDAGITIPIANDLRLSFGGGGSWESDFTSYSTRAALTKDLNNKNTTLSLGVNVERDNVKPFYGIPAALAGMGEATIGTSRIKHVYSMVAGFTQVLRPNWLVQFNYSFGHGKGYQTDPYKLVSLIEPDTGNPFWYIYEKRPSTRNRHSIYFGTKLALGSAVTDASARYYHDSWGIDSVTFELSERLPVGQRFYVEPEFRFYHQTAARFFRHYLMIDEPTPDYVSADSRLDRFEAVTFGIKAGAKIVDGLEAYGAFERYQQSGKTFDRAAPGALSGFDLFGGTKSISVMAGLKLTLP